MKNIFLAPRANETSFENFESTIIKGRPYDFVEPFLTPPEKEMLSQYETLSIWGNKESLKSRWDVMKPGDYVLFYKKGLFYYSAEVVLTKYSEELGGKLWPADEDGKVWPCLFFVTNLQQIEIPIQVVQELAEYEPSWDRVQGFMRLRDEGVAAIIDKFGNIEAFINQTPEVYTFIENIIERNKEEIVEGVVEKEIDTEKILREVTAYKDSGPSHTSEIGVVKKRIENKQQKLKIAQLEGHACQLCNWSMQWVNAKGEISYRIDVDHIIDKAKGGGEEKDNLWVLCPNCHAKKTRGVVTIDPAARVIKENGVVVKLHHDKHLRWE